MPLMQSGVDVPQTLPVPPQIHVTFDRQSRTITVTDNGDGMSKADITHFFAKIGSSAATLAAAAADAQYRAVGEFGIGVLSYFLICQHFELHSLRLANEPIGLEFSRDMLDNKTPAGSIEPRQAIQGTELVLCVEKEAPLRSTPREIPLLGTPR